MITQDLCPLCRHPSLRPPSAPTAGRSNQHLPHSGGTSLQDEHGRILLGLRHPDSAYAGNQWHFLAVR
jgi:hypothetical protein